MAIGACPYIKKVNVQMKKKYPAPLVRQLVKEACHEDWVCDRLLSELQKRERDARLTTVEDVVRAVGCTRVEAVTALKKLEAIDCGLFKKGRTLKNGARPRSHSSRLEWAYDVRTLKERGITL